MRWIELTESGTLDTYTPMINALVPFMNEKDSTDFERTLKKIREVLVTKPRVTWAMKWYRLGLAKKLLADNADPSLNKAYVGFLRQVPQTSDIDREVANFYPTFSSSYQFGHLLSLSSQEIKNYQFLNTPTNVLNALKAIEKKWIASRDSSVELQPDDEKIIDFGNGWAWFQLSRGSCRDEGNAMGHCGNVPSEKEGDTILSLRKKISSTNWSPHLTFILHENGYIGEMKGRGNEKPVERYHAMITALLEHPRIRGIVGGGYAPENNFKLTDLHPDEVARLREMKPGFYTARELLDMGKRKEALEVISAQIGDERAGEIQGFYDDTYVIVDSYRNLDSYISDNCYDYSRVFEEVEKEFGGLTLRNQNGEYIDGDALYEKFYADYHDKTFMENYYYFVDYALSEISVRFQDDDTVKVTIPLDDIPSGNDEEAYISPHESITTVRDYGGYSWSDIEGNFNGDEISEEILKCYFSSSRKKDASDLVSAIYAKYVDRLEGGGTEKHPDQGEFDF